MGGWLTQASATVQRSRSNPARSARDIQSPGRSTIRARFPSTAGRLISIHFRRNLRIRTMSVLLPADGLRNPSASKRTPTKQRVGAVWLGGDGVVVVVRRHAWRPAPESRGYGGRSFARALDSPPTGSTSSCTRAGGSRRAARGGSFLPPSPRGLPPAADCQQQGAKHRDREVCADIPPQCVTHAYWHVANSVLIERV